MSALILGQAGYWAIIALMMIGLYIAFSAENLLKRLVGLSLFQTTICLFYVSLSKVDSATAPILLKADRPEALAPVTGLDGELVTAGAARVADLAAVYVNPLPHVLTLTAIVVSVATLAVGLALVVRIREAYGTIEADEVRALDLDTAIAEDAGAGSARAEAAA
jgi:multicomponent Na+:H+ antiporter subunit C